MRYLMLILCISFILVGCEDKKNYVVVSGDGENNYSFRYSQLEMLSKILYYFEECGYQYYDSRYKDWIICNKVLPKSQMKHISGDGWYCPECAIMVIEDLKEVK